MKAATVKAINFQNIERTANAQSLPALSRNLSIFIILIAFIVMGYFWITLIPPFEKPDEISHYAYIQYVAEKGFLFDLREVQYPLIAEAQQPPLYYAIGALIYKFTTWQGVLPTTTASWVKRMNPNFYWSSKTDRKDVNQYFQDGSFPLDIVILRGYSLFISCFTIYFTFKTARRFFKTTVLPALISAAFVAFLPQFLFVSTTITNDNLAIAIGSFFIYRFSAEDQSYLNPTSNFWLGIIAGLGILSKLTFAALLPLVFWQLLRARDSLRKRLISLLIFGVGICSICAWWFIRNYYLYGDLLGEIWKLFPAAFAWDMNRIPLLQYFTGSIFWPNVGQSFVAKFGFMHIAMPPAFYNGWLFVSLIPAIGLLLFAGRAVFRKLQPGTFPKPNQVFLQGLASAVTLLQLVYFNIHVAQPQGRYLFEALPSLAILWVFGFMVIIDLVYPQIKKKISERLAIIFYKLTPAIIFLLVTINIYALFFVVVPAYRNLGN